MELEPQTLAFLDGSLPPEAFDHQAHVRAGWDLIRCLGAEDGAARFASGLRDYVAHHGAADRYHATLTRSLLALIASHTGPETRSWQAFSADAAPLLDDAREVIGRFYSPERLAAPEARRRFVTPDRAPLPTVAP